MGTMPVAGLARPMVGHSLRTPRPGVHLGRGAGLGEICRQAREGHGHSSSGRLPVARLQRLRLAVVDLPW